MDPTHPPIKQKSWIAHLLLFLCRHDLCPELRRNKRASRLGRAAGPTAAPGPTKRQSAAYQDAGFFQPPPAGGYRNRGPPPDIPIVLSVAGGDSVLRDS